MQTQLVDGHELYQIGYFVRAHETAIPDRWHIVDRGLNILGVVKWYPKWGEYIFAPMNGAEFSQECLRDIQRFLVKRAEGRERVRKLLNERPTHDTAT
ncbi:MAG: hypothetical protein AB7I37_26265 [Pirellulales bacterium]